MMAATQPALTIRGEVRFYEAGDKGCLVEASVEGLPTGPNAHPFLAFHIHENGSCADAGMAAGGHYNPEGRQHGYHAGDLPSLLNADGIAESVVYTDRFVPGDVIGRTAIIHELPDDYRTQPNGSGGPRIACGVIEMV